MKKVVIYGVMFLYISLFFLNSCGTTEKNKEEKEVLSGEILFWDYNKEISEKFIEKFTKENKNIKINVKYFDDKNTYNENLKNTLLSGGNIPDIYALDNYNLKEIMDIENSLENLENDKYMIGKYLNNMIEYTNKISRNGNGELKAVALYLNPAGIAYKRDISSRYFGTDEEEDIQEIFSNYVNIIEGGKELEEKSDGKCKLFTDTDDFFDYYAVNREKSWIDSDNKFTIDEKIDEYIKLSKRIEELNLDSDIEYLSDKWNESLKDNIHFAYPIDLNSIRLFDEVQNDINYMRRWGIIQGENPYFKENTWYGIYGNSKVKDIAAVYLKFVLENNDIMKELTKEKMIFSNNIKVMNDLANDETNIDDFSGTNHFKIFNEFTKNAKGILYSEDYNEIKEILNKHLNDYTKETIEKNVMWDKIKNDIKESENLNEILFDD